MFRFSYKSAKKQLVKTGRKNPMSRMSESAGMQRKKDGDGGLINVYGM